ncbi:hypothetical protein PINS_up001742 [Pythium insidiosum]|nr:hypothetical protein PINS_up001742 [Pythium insidiosum]
MEAVHAPLERRELYVTRRQLRTSLETPSLLLSKAEMNLLVALAVATPTGLLPVSQLPELLQHVQTTIFRYQCHCFNDRIERYLLQQFTSFETSKLQGSAEHLKMKIRQREVKTVVRDMKKLALSPLQVSRVVSACEDEPLDIDYVVNYKDCVQRIARVLRHEIDEGDLETRATLMHQLASADDERLLRADDEQIRQIAMEAFENKTRTAAASSDSPSSSRRWSKRSFRRWAWRSRRMRARLYASSACLEIRWVKAVSTTFGSSSCCLRC